MGIENFACIQNKYLLCIAGWLEDVVANFCILFSTVATAGSMAVWWRMCLYVVDFVKCDVSASDASSQRVFFNSVALGQVEFILMGGTFMSLPSDYRDYFIRNLHDALSGHSSHDVQEAVQYSEHGAVKCIGLTIET